MNIFQLCKKNTTTPTNGRFLLILPKLPVEEMEEPKVKTQLNNMAAAYVSFYILCLIATLSILPSAESTHIDLNELENKKYGIEISSHPVLLNENRDSDSYWSDDEAADKGSSHSPPENSNNIVYLSSKFGQMYQCALPTEPGDVAEGDGDSVGLQSDTVNISSMLSLLDGLCFIHWQGWWSYELCYKQNITQFHYEKGQSTKNRILLGTFQSEYDWEDSSPDDPEVTKKYHSQKYTNGSKCHLLDISRTTEVRYVCNEESSEYIHRVDEPSSCSYVITVHSQAVCNYEHLSPVKSTGQLDILCQPVLNKHEYDKYIQSTQDREHRMYEGQRSVVIGDEVIIVEETDPEDSVSSTDQLQEADPSDENSFNADSLDENSFDADSLDENSFDADSLDENLFDADSLDEHWLNWLLDEGEDNPGMTDEFKVSLDPALQSALERQDQIQTEILKTVKDFQTFSVYYNQWLLDLDNDDNDVPDSMQVGELNRLKDRIMELKTTLETLRQQMTDIHTEISQHTESVFDNIIDEVLAVSPDMDRNSLRKVLVEIFDGSWDETDSEELEVDMALLWFKAVEVLKKYKRFLNNVQDNNMKFMDDQTLRQLLKISKAKTATGSVEKPDTDEIEDRTGVPESPTSTMEDSATPPQDGATDEGPFHVKVSLQKVDLGVTEWKKRYDNQNTMSESQKHIENKINKELQRMGAVLSSNMELRVLTEGGDFENGEFRLTERETEQFTKLIINALIGSDKKIEEDKFQKLEENYSFVWNSETDPSPSPSDH